jgi:D-tyrosyl-tRNA(Tyr) deacylase
VIGLVQRVSSASVTVEGRVVGSVGRGLLVFVGVAGTDTGEKADALARKCSALRIFNDADGKMNLSVRDVGGSVLAVSQFTLCADTSGGHRPGFSGAAPPGPAKTLYDRFCEALRGTLGDERVATGTFGAMMEVSLVNDGPATFILQV